MIIWLSIAVKIAAPFVVIWAHWLGYKRGLKEMNSER